MYARAINSGWPINGLPSIACSASTRGKRRGQSRGNGFRLRVRRSDVRRRAAVNLFTLVSHRYRRNRAFWQSASSILANRRPVSEEILRTWIDASRIARLLSMGGMFGEHRGFWHGS